MFIGRQRELKTLNDHYSSGSFEFFCIYGRRRVGKTQLIKEFARDKKTIFFTCVEDTKNVNLAGFSFSVHETLHKAKGRLVYADFKQAFVDIYESAKKDRLVLAIDEFPYLAKNYPGISSLLQVEIDHRLKDTDIFIILCGSSMSFMENQVMGHKSPLYGRRTGQVHKYLCQMLRHKSPLYGRRTGQIKTLPFDYETSGEFYPQKKEEEKAVIYGITGGIAKYLRLFSNSKKLDDNITKNFFSADELLFEEPSNLLKQELREPALYNSIITAVANGASKVNQIVTKTGLDSAICVKYLGNLIELGIVNREIPIMEKQTSKKSIYRLNDGMFRFWYRFVYANISRIQLGLGEQVLADIKPKIPDFMGEVFEHICKEYMWKAKLPFIVSNVGRWWGNNPIRKCEQEIDLIAIDSSKSKSIFAECKWRGEKMSAGVIDELIDKAQMFNFEEKYYYFFSKSGFTATARKKASNKIVLIDFTDMFS